MVSFVLLSLFYKVVLKDFINRKWFNVLIIIYLLFFFINIAFIQSIYEYPNLTYSVFALIIILFSLIVFFKTMIDSKITHLFNEPIFWINTAIILSFTGNLFLFLMFNDLLEYSSSLLKKIYTFFHLLNGVYYSLIAIGFWKAKKAETAGNLLR